MARLKKVTTPVKPVTKPVDYQALCQKLQSALSKSYVDFDELQKRHNDAVVGIARQEVIIQYLESKFK
jgi:Tfp pilus assembly PilM family ATPase